MYTVILITLPVLFILWALSRTTEKVLAIRQGEREKGKKPSVYL